ncbi:MAG: sugar porter family MFS transporter [bacterium]|nr:sugar porter family MFS transporter [bacterium]
MSTILSDKTLQPELKPKLKLLTLIIVIVAPFSGIRYGLDMGVISGALGPITREFNLTTTQQGFIVGAVLAGGAFALLIAGFLSDLIGRKKMIIVGAVLFVIGAFMIGYSEGYLSVLTGRLVMGTGVGITSVLIPLYLAEVAPAHIRGKAIVAYQLCLTIGILTAYIVDLGYVKSGDWRSMFLLLNYPGIVFLICCFVLPESPVWYFLKGKKDLSVRVLNKVHYEEEAVFIMQEMEVLKKENAEDGSNSFFKKTYFIPFLIGFIVACLTPLTGIDVIIEYCPTILKHCGVGPESSIAIGVAIMAVNVIVTIIAILLIDRLGRKPLLLISSLISFISLIVIAIGTLLPNAEAVKVTLIASGMFGFIFGFGIGIGVVVWLAMSELLPSKIRSRGIAIALFGNTVIDTTLLTYFLDVEKAIGYSSIFFILAGITLFYFIFTLLFFPETKGKSIEEIEEYFRKDKKVTSCKL